MRKADCLGDVVTRSEQRNLVCSFQYLGSQYLAHGQCTVGTHLTLSKNKFLNIHQEKA